MAISEQQLQTWSQQGAKEGSAKTYQEIKKAVLEDQGSPYAGLRKVFLQGSYGNDTNIYAESDVDIVICLTEEFDIDDGSLSPADRTDLWKAVYPSYDFSKFREAIFHWLKQKYGNGVKLGKKAIFVPGNNGRRDADVVVCVEHRRYTSYKTERDSQYDPGICFWKADGTKIVNFPEKHKKNLTNKHQETNGLFKANVRVLKNMRQAMIKHDLLADGVAPSYFLEGMLWNVPNEYFTNSFQKTFENYLHYLQRCDLDLTKLTCANNLHDLIRDECQVCWNTSDFRTFISSARHYWETSSQ